MKQVMVGDVVMPAAEVAKRPWEPLAPGAPAGIANTILSEHGGTIAGVLRIPAGVTLPAHAHRGMGHHVWVVDGAAHAFDRSLPRGSYWFVGAGHAHAIEGLAPDGCTLFYVDVPET
ncbi:MAG TPA: cupin domain-containing protein [Candidatus Dormibacteraeota bacterium]|nr:cupin domain-containing protein [Candidatus Dormibacteraeota bacterium]